jgi:hypothetical protein
VALAVTLGFVYAHPVMAETDPPDIELTIRLDPASGSFTAETVMEFPSGEVALPDADWLSVDAVTLTGTGGSLLPPAGRASIGPEEHRARPLRVVVSGRLPGLQRQLAAVAWTSDASYAVGPAVFPVDATALRDHRITIIVSSDQRVAATGRLLFDRVAGERREAGFAFTGRSEDVGLFIGRYTLSERGHASGTLRTYFDAADVPLSDRYFEALAAYLDRYEAEIGRYPYDGFSVVSAPIPVGLGFAGLTYVGRDILGHPYMTGRSLAHEVLHSWWGNAVGVDYASGNWAEGLTTFMADYRLAEESGPEAARDMRLGWVRALSTLPEDEMQPLTAFRAASHAGTQGEGYGKAAFVFHMLRDEIGAQAFEEGIRAFYRENRDEIAGWADLQQAFEAASGRDLGWFFEQWVSRAGLPRLSLGGAEVTDGSVGATVTLRISQSAPSYRLRLPVVFQMPDGARAQRVVQIDGPESVVSVTLPDKPALVRVDPGFDLARHPFRGELAPILRSVAAAGPLRGVAADPVGAAEAQIARALLPLTGVPDLPFQSDLPEEGTEHATLVVGTTEEVLSVRPSWLGPPPDVARDGATRLWIEREEGGALWLFLSYDDLDAVASDLRALRYYSGLGHVAFEDGQAVASGIWPAGEGAGFLRFEGAEPGEIAP